MKKISLSEDSLDPDRVNKIAQAANGLIYISETDAELVPFEGEKCESVAAKDLLDLSLGTKQEPIEEVAPDQFFALLTQIKDWYGPAEKDRAGRFAQLYSILKEELRDIRVLRIGTIQIDIYIAGIDGAGRLAGVWTRAVET